MKYDTATAYLASYVLLKQGSKVAFVLRENTTWMNGYYSLVSGKVEKGESFAQAANREAKEESGVAIKAKDLKPILSMQRREATDLNMLWIDQFFEVLKYSGKPYNALPKEHAELAWLDPLNLPKNVIPSLRFALEQIRLGKNYVQYGF